MGRGSESPVKFVGHHDVLLKGLEILGLFLGYHDLGRIEDAVGELCFADCGNEAEEENKEGSPPQGPPADGL